MSEDNHSIFINQGFIDCVAEKEPDLKKLYTCMQCGSCTSSCVAADGMQKTPRKLFREMQMGMEEDVMSSDSYWNCTTCGLCEKRCPRKIPLSSIIVRLRELNVKKDGMLQKLEQAVSTLEKSRNIAGDLQQNRLLWIDNMGLDKNAASQLIKKSADVVYYTGCVSSLYPQAYKIPQTLTKLLLEAKINFTLLENEWCCSYPVMASGKGPDALKEYISHNMEEIYKKGASEVIVSCPTCYYMFTKVYPMVLGEIPDIKIMHYTEYLNQVLKNSKIDFSEEKAIVTYHDPCDLGRKLHITEQPRQLLKSLPGVSLVEMRFNGEEGKCCGGGGNLEMINPDLSYDIALKRLEEAAATEASILLTSCQQCKRTLQNAARKARMRIKVNDILEFIEARLAPGPEV